jgi:hypothetical protein
VKIRKIETIRGREGRKDEESVERGRDGFLCTYPNQANKIIQGALKLTTKLASLNG